MFLIYCLELSEKGGKFAKNMKYKILIIKQGAKQMLTSQNIQDPPSPCIVQIFYLILDQFISR